MKKWIQLVSGHHRRGRSKEDCKARPNQHLVYWKFKIDSDWELTIIKLFCFCFTWVVSTMSTFGHWAAWQNLSTYFVTLGGLPLVDEGFSQARWTHSLKAKKIIPLDRPPACFPEFWPAKRWLLNTVDTFEAKCLSDLFVVHRTVSLRAVPPSRTRLPWQQSWCQRTLWIAMLSAHGPMVVWCRLPSGWYRCLMVNGQDITQSLQSVAYVSMALERHADEEQVNK